MNNRPPMPAPMPDRRSNVVVLEAPAFAGRCAVVRHIHSMRWILASALVLSALAFLSACAATNAAKVDEALPTEFVGPPESQPADRAAEEFETLVHDIEHAIAAREYRNALRMIRGALLTELSAVQARRMELIHERAKTAFFS